MKSTESIDETAKSTDSSLADGEATGLGKASILDERRRHLIRGVAAAAPLVLTLRSGALAAASCTGTKVIAVGTNGSGQFTAPTDSGVAEGDYCVANVQVCGPELPTKISGGTIDVGTISGPLPSGKFQCGTTGSRTVAILSAASVTSLRG